MFTAFLWLKLGTIGGKLQFKYLTELLTAKALVSFRMVLKVNLIVR